MRRAQGDGPADLRGFRWSLQPVEGKLDAEVENARLALARLHQQSRALEEAERRRADRQREQENVALQRAKQDVLAGARAMRYLVHLDAERLAADSVRADLRQQVAVAREACAERQRQLESVQALRLEAQREHTQARRRREWREADAAWLALAGLRRATNLRRSREAE